MLGLFIEAGRVASGRSRRSLTSMPFNPFAPPNAAVVDRLHEHDLRKPWSVWFTQVVAALLAAVMAVMLIRLVGNAQRILAASSAGWVDLAPRFAIDIGLIALALVTVVGGQLRLALARWSGLLLMLLVLVLDAVLVVAVAGWLPTTSERFHMTTADVAGVLAVVASAALALAVAWACCFSARTRAWFG